MGEIEFIEQTIRKYPEILTHVDGIARIKNKLMDENCKNFFGGLIAKLRSTGIQTKDFASDREFPSFRIFGTSRGQIFSNLPNMFIRVEGYRSRGILSVGVSTHECKDVAMPRWSEFEQLNRTLRTKFPNHDNCARPSLNVCWPTGTLVLLKPWFDNAEYLANLLKIRSQLDIDVDAAFHQIVGYVSLVQDAWNTVKITESPEMSESTI